MSGRRNLAPAGRPYLPDGPRLGEDDRPAVIWAFEDAEMDYTGPATDLRTGVQFRPESRPRLADGHVYPLGEHSGTAGQGSSS